MKRVVISGGGLVCGLGNNLETAWQALTQGASGVKRFPEASFREEGVQIAAIPSLDTTKLLEELTVKSKAAAYGMLAVQEALETSQLPMENTDSTSLLAEITGQNTYSGNKLSGLKRIFHSFGSQLALNFKVRGRVQTFISPFGEMNALGEAFNAIKWGEQDRVILVGASPEVDQDLVRSFVNLGFLNTEENARPEAGFQPYGEHAKGTVLGEGAACLVLEELESAQKRSAPILAEVVSYASSNDAAFLTKPSEEAEGLTRAITQALERAGLSNVDLVVGEGTSIPERDRAELIALRNVFSNAKVTSSKPSTGHTLSASSAMQTLFAAKAVSDKAFPILNVNKPLKIDSKHPVEYLETDQLKPQSVLVTSMGLGGHNSSLILKMLN